MELGSLFAAFIPASAVVTEPQQSPIDVCVKGVSRNAGTGRGVLKTYPVSSISSISPLIPQTHLASQTLLLCYTS